MGFCLSARNQSGVVIALSPHQYHNAPPQPSQAHQPFFPIFFEGVLAGQHWAVKHGVALSQVNLVLALVLLPLGRVVAHAFSVYAFMWSGKASSVWQCLAQQGTPADRFASASLRQHVGCVLALGALREIILM
jgi:hypothetical protein